MSDNDLISRMALYEKTAEWEAQALHMVELHLHDDDKSEWRKWSTVLTERTAFKQDVADAPAVPHEMTAREYEKALDRAFHSDDDAYGEWADAIDEGNKDKAVAIIEKWAQEHPERSEE